MKILYENRTKRNYSKAIGRRLSENNFGDCKSSQLIIKRLIKVKVKMKNAKLTIFIQKDEESGWYAGQIEEFPAAISQGRTIEELKENLLDALKLLLDTQSAQLKNDYKEQKVLKRKLIYA
ncbi:MAG: type II toxin-antitoxin system HicB family antitoxin [bacterium]